jgi:hypothetical protein
LGIKKKEGHFFWSAKDIEKLKKLYPQGDQYEVAEAIGRGVKAVTAKANKLGLKKKR